MDLTDKNHSFRLNTEFELPRREILQNKSDKSYKPVTEEESMWKNFARMG